MDRRGFFKSMLGKGLSHGARQVDAVIIPFERAARAARDAIPGEEAAADDPALAGEEAPEREPELTLVETPALPAEPVARPCGEEDLMRVAADAGLIRRVEAAVALARRSVRLVPGDGPPPPGSRSRLGGAPDLPAGEPWPEWDGEPLAFLAQIDLADARAAGLDPLLPDAGALLVFCALERTPSGASPLDADSARVLLVAPDNLPQPAPAPTGPCQPAEARELLLSSELALPRVWTEAVQRLDLDEQEQEAWERARRDLADLQGVSAWEAGAELRSLHRLLGHPEESRGDMPLAAELAARGIDVGYGAPAAHPEAGRAVDAAERWRLLLQLTVDEQLGWRFGRGRERLYVWAPADDLAAGRLDAARALAR